MISKLDTFFDAVPRSGANPVVIGAFTLFVSNAPFGYYARPSLAHPKSVNTSDLVALEEACVERDVELSIEWVHETHPELSGMAGSHGLEVRSHALMVVKSGEVLIPKLLEGVTVRLVNADDSALVDGLAVANLSFGFGGTEPGSVGHIERDIAVAALDEEFIEYFRNRVRQGLIVTAVAKSDDGVLAVGSYQRANNCAEIVGVATLPAARGRGLAGALTALLATHALEEGVEMVLLSAQNVSVARVYERVGFRRVGSTGAAERRRK